MSKEQCAEIYKTYTIHEKKYGDKVAIEDVIISKRKFQYEEVSESTFLLFWVKMLAHFFKNEESTILFPVSYVLGVLRGDLSEQINKSTILTFFE